jgi:chromosome segregation protein
MMREVVLENFMSYEYARVPFKPGVNVIVGPNGSGKSSIVLALAVALGQTYTERSRRLSDLIRRGKEYARVTVVLNNRGPGGKKLWPQKRDEVRLSRYIQKNGDYWHEIDFKAASKAEVERLLDQAGIQPDNMLLVMHQSMIENFGAVNAAEKLRLVEEAAGLAEFRQRVQESRETLMKMGGEKESLDAMLNRAEETLKYWEREYGKLKRKRELEAAADRLRGEAAWSQALRAERSLETLREDLRAKERNRAEARGAAGAARTEAEGLRDRVEERLTALEREAEAGRKPEAARERRGVTEAVEGYAEAAAQGAVAGFREELLGREVRELERRIVEAERDLAEKSAEAKRAGPRVETQRRLPEILDELRLAEAERKTLEWVSAEVEEIYANYRRMEAELREKARAADENRRRALGELEERREKWKEAVGRLLAEVSARYREVLAAIHATGDVGLAGPGSLEEAGLELRVGFRGSEPHVLDAMTQSGGERTTATMAFLLALQGAIASPLRAVDEFDVHMDPVNREAVFRQMFAGVGEGRQYVAVTPGPVVPERGAHVLVVQNVGGRSEVSVVA